MWSIGIYEQKYEDKYITGVYFLKQMFIFLSFLHILPKIYSGYKLIDKH